jgi:hypothetical protein
MHKNNHLIIITFLLPLFSIAQMSSSSITLHTKLIPKTTSILHKMGDGYIKIKTAQYGESSGIVFINLHHDESTSVNATISQLESQGGLFIQLDNGNKRNIRFKLDGRYYSFDPNRIFSREGIIQTLTYFGRINNRAIVEIEKLADRLLLLIPPKPSCIIALHNNTDGKFSIESYLPGKERATDAKSVYVSREQDPDDIFLTTDSILYTNLSNENYNVIWENKETVRKDGSLSVYCGERNIRYLNCETEHGKTSQYEKMINAAAGYFRKETTEQPILYTYTLPIPENEVPLSSETVLFFGDKKIGEIKSVVINEDGSYSGKIAVAPSFRLYNNMEFIITQSEEEKKTMIEVRIDPTTEKLPINPEADKVTLSIKNK